MYKQCCLNHEHLCLAVDRFQMSVLCDRVHKNLQKFMLQQEYYLLYMCDGLTVALILHLGGTCLLRSISFLYTVQT
jgi:hypothetical protein